MRTTYAESLTSLVGAAERNSAAENTIAEAEEASSVDIIAMGLQLMNNQSSPPSTGGSSTRKRKKKQGNKNKREKEKPLHIMTGKPVEYGSLPVPPSPFDHPISPEQSHSSPPEDPPTTRVIVIYRDKSNRCHGAVTSDGTLVVNRGNYKWFDKTKGIQYPNVIYSDQMSDSIQGKQLSIGDYEVGRATRFVALESSLQHGYIPSYMIEKEK